MGEVRNKHASDSAGTGDSSFECFATAEVQARKIVPVLLSWDDEAQESARQRGCDFASRLQFLGAEIPENLSNMPGG